MRNRGLRADADQAVGVVDRHPLVPGELAAAATPAAAIVPGIQPCAGVHEELDHRRSSLVPGAVQRRPAIVSLRVRIEAEFEQPAHRFEVVLLRPLLGDPLDPADARRHHQRGDVEGGRDLRIGAAGQQQLHHDQVG
jgi:hypothetical protein